MDITLFTLLCVLQYYIFVCKGENYDLKQLIVVSRHGDRKPVYYPNDPYTNYWKRVPQAKLTKNGIRRSFKVGEELRKAYKSFVSIERRDVYAKSQDSDVCLETAETILAALFPPQESDVWNPDLPWQPFAVHTQPLITDNALAVFARCPVAEDAQNKVLESKQVSKFIESEAEFLKYVSEMSGLELNSLIDASRLFDTLSTEKDGGFKLPSWVTDEVYEHLKKFSDLFMTINSTPMQVKRLRGGPLLKLIRDRLDMVNRAYLAPFMKKFVLFSTQGQIIATLLNTLNVSNELAPPISAALLFELRENKENNQYFVKVIYFNETSINSSHTLYLPSCYYQEMCPLNLFLEIVEKMIPTDWEAECQFQSDSKSKTKKSDTNIPGLPKIPGLPQLPNLPKIPGFGKSSNSKKGANSKKGTNSKKGANSKKGTNSRYLPTKTQQSNVLKDTDSQTASEPSKAILVIPILGYVLLASLFLVFIFGVIILVLKLNRRSLYEIV